MSIESDSFAHRWFNEVWNKGRVSAIDEMLAEDAVTHGLGEAGVEIRGPAAFKPFVARLRGAFPDIAVTVEQTIAEGDWIASRWSARMTHSGDDLGVPATGKHVTVTGMSMARVREGKMIEGWNNWDMLGLMQQIGGTSPPASLLE